MTTGSSQSSRMKKLSPSLLRHALRLIHCLQKERGASCAYSVSVEFRINMQIAREQADVALLLFAKDREPVTSTLLKIRSQLDERVSENDEHLSRFHRILVLFNTLIGSVVHTYILQHVNSTSMQRITSTAQIKRSTSAESFVPFQTPPLPLGQPRQASEGFQSTTVRRSLSPPSKSSSSQQDTLLLSSLNSVPKVSISSPSSPVASSNSFQKYESPKSSSYPETSNGMTSSHRRMVGFNGPSIKSLTPLDPVTALLNLLSCFVRLKESTGLERALLSGMLSIGAVHPRLLADLVMEVENQSLLVEELREQTTVEASLLQLIREGVVLPPQLQMIQNQILQKFNLIGMQLPSTQTVWNVITVYMDRLHSLELLLIEELEGALVTSLSIIPTLEETPLVLQSILRDLYWYDLPSDVIKSKLMEFMEGNTGSSSTSGSHVPTPIGISDANILPNSHTHEKSEWDISLYEIQFQKRIGRGTAGTTYLATWSGQEVAVKVAATTEMGLEGWTTETASLQRLHHPNIIRLLGSIYNPSPLTYCLVLEFCNSGDLGAALVNPTPTNFFDRVSKDMANGLAFLHSRDVIHRDIKPANVLLHGNVQKGDFVAKVTDFGVAINQKHHGTNRTAETGTYRWMAPEVIRHESYSETADVYSFAVVLWQLITREDPFFDKSPIEAAGKVALELARPALPDGTPDSVTALIERCWSEDPSHRYSFVEVSKQLLCLELSATERAWMQTPMGHQIYFTRVESEIADRPHLPQKAQSERNPDLKPGKKGFRSLFSKKSI